jgi:hypothetical protein
MHESSALVTRQETFMHRLSVKLIHISLNSLLRPTICLRKHKHFYPICIAFTILCYNVRVFTKLGDDIEHKEYIVTSRAVRVMQITGSSSDDWVY